MKKIDTELEFGIKFFYSILKLPLLIPFILFSTKARKEFITPIKTLISFFTQTKITTSLIFINILMFLIQILFLDSDIIFKIATLQLQITKLISLNYLINIILSWFLHGNIFHLLNNILALFVFGRIVEKYLKEKYLSIYIISAFVGSIISLSFSQPGIGASGAIAGIILAAILIKPFYLSFIAIIPLPIFILGWFSIFSDITGAFSFTKTNIGYWAHLGGYFGAFLTSFILIKKSEQKNKLKNGLMINIILLLTFILLRVLNSQ